MSSPTRGRLPAHVYRRRRLAVLTVAVLLVLGFGRVLSWGSDASDGDADQAVQAAADTKASGDATPSASPSATKTKKKNKNKNKDKTPSPTPTPLAQPTGPCPDADVTVTPSVPEPVAGRDVVVVLNLQTGTTEACTWHVSAETVTLSISDGPDDIWSSRECPHVIPSTDVVVRRAQATPVPVTWSSKRSDEYCTERTAWVLPGTYSLAAAAFGGEPTEVTFELVTPTAPVVTQTAEPTQKPKKGKNKNRN